MIKFRPFLSFLFTLIGTAHLISIVNNLDFSHIFSFGISGPATFFFLIFYSFLGVLFAYLSKENTYKVFLLCLSGILLILSILITLIGAFAFQNP